MPKKKKWEQYTKEELQEMCSRSHSLTEFGKLMGYCSNGVKGISAAKEVIQKFNLDHSSIITYDNVIKGENPNKGKIDYSKFIKSDIRKIGNRTKESIKKNLIQLRGHKCEKCGLSEWRNQPISLELHHIDGDRCNNELENLQLLCPNCHSQTPNYRGKGTIKQKVTDDELALALSTSTSVRQAVMKLGLADTVGGMYNRCYRIMAERDIHLLSKKDS